MTQQNISNLNTWSQNISNRMLKRKKLHKTKMMTSLSRSFLVYVTFSISTSCLRYFDFKFLDLMGFVGSLKIWAPISHKLSNYFTKTANWSVLLSCFLLNRLFRPLHAEWNRLGWGSEPEIPRTRRRCILAPLWSPQGGAWAWALLGDQYHHLNSHFTGMSLCQPLGDLLWGMHTYTYYVQVFHPIGDLMRWRYTTS